LARLGRRPMISDTPEALKVEGLDCSPVTREAARAGAWHDGDGLGPKLRRRGNLGQNLGICTGDSGGDRLQVMPVVGCGESARIGTATHGYPFAHSPRHSWPAADRHGKLGKLQFFILGDPGGCCGVLGGGAGGFQGRSIKTFCKNAEFAVPPTRRPRPAWPVDARIPVPLPSTAESPARRPYPPWAADARHPQPMRPMTPPKSHLSRHLLANLLHPPYTAQSQS